MHNIAFGWRLCVRVCALANAYLDSRRSFQTLIEWKKNLIMWNILFE